MDLTDETRYKTSIFTNLSRSRLINDLYNRSYKFDHIDIEILQHCSLTDANLESLQSFISHPDLESRFQRLINAELLIPAYRDETAAFFPHRIDIETCRHCNARCQYCPQSVSQKTYGVMSLDLFELILSKLAPVALQSQLKPQWLALNHYNEPLLDPHFKERVKILRERELPLRLFTNAVLLTESLINFLGDGGLYGVIFNFPSLEPAEWCRFMQLPEKQHWQARWGIENFLSQNKIPDKATIVVNGIMEDQVQRAENIKNHFSAFGQVKVECSISHSRAGTFNNDLVKSVEHPAGCNFAGCKRFAGHLHVSWEGKVFLCCQDYDQQVILGDLRNDSLASIMSSSKARQLRAEIFGLAPMSPSRLCLKCPMLRKTRFSMNEEALLDCESEIAFEEKPEILLHNSYCE